MSDNQPSKSSNPIWKDESFHSQPVTSAHPKERKLPGRMTILLVLFLLVSLTFLWFSFTYLSSYFYDSFNEQQVDMVSTPGETLFLNIRLVPEPINGLWKATSALSLRLDDVPAPIPLVTLNQGNWGDFIQIHQQYNVSYDYEQMPLTISTKYTLPSSLAGPAERVLKGRITGTILYPEPNLLGADPGTAFKNSSLDLAVPVTLDILPQGEFAWKSGHLMCVSITLLDMLIFACLPLIFRFYEKRTKSRPWYTVTYRNQRNVIIVASILLVLLSFGIIFPLVNISEPHIREVYFLGVGLIVALVIALVGTALLQFSLKSH